MHSPLRKLPLALLMCMGLAHASTLEVLVLDRDGKPTPDAVVIAVPVGKGQPKTPLPNSAVINQEKQQFVPYLTVVAAGARVRFSNSDPWNHHVRLGAAGATAGNADGQSMLLEGKVEGKPASTTVVTMDKPGATGAALLGCFIHSRMGGVVYVADSAWTVKTGPNGVAMLEDVPEGAVTLKVWHASQLVDKLPQSLTMTAVPAKATLQLDVVVKRRG
jgi:plastocyanin